MPSRANTTSRTTTTTGAAPAGASTMRFELPALDFKFGSLTDGTDIPPPLPSPVKEEQDEETKKKKEETGPTPPDTPTTEDATNQQQQQQQRQQQQQQQGATNGKLDAATPSPLSQHSSVSGTKRRADDNPASPTRTSRPSSIRRLFSRGLLNTASANANANGSADGAAPSPGLSPGQGRDGARRPPSGGSGSGSVADSRKARRASGWFGRLRGVSGGDAAAAAAAPLSPPSTGEKAVPAGPPPPRIPELSEINSKLGIQGESGFGSDLFKDIK